MNSNQNKDYSGAAIVCSHVASGQFPIMIAERSESDDAVDTGWQFVCDAQTHENVEDAIVWSINEVLELEPSLEGLLDQPPGRRLIRRDRFAPWKVTR